MNIILKTPVIFLRSLNEKRGGVTKASLKRANMFAEEYKEVIIVTTLFQVKHKQIIDKLKSNGELAENVTVYNFFEDMRKVKRKRILNNNKIKHSVKEKGYTEFYVKDHPDKSYRYYKDGFYKMYKRFVDGQIHFVDYMDNSGKRIKRAEFDENGILVRERFMDLNLNKPRFDKYYDYNGNCVLSVHVNPKTGEDGNTVFFGSTPKEYRKLYTLQTEWLNNLLNKISNPVVFCELRGLDKMLINVKHPSIKKVAVTHSSHLESPYDDITKLRPIYHELFSSDKYDQYVFLTNSQKKDVETVYNKNDKFIVIPHTYSHNTSENFENIQRNKHLAVTIARYAEDKRIEEGIHAFRLVVDKIPEAKYYIYGKGELEQQLQDLIDKLKLGNNVYLKGYTTNPGKIYRSAACSILTSRREGFGLVIIESLAEGTPVVTYDFKYGPRDIITDGENGFIVENGNRKELAEKIIDLMSIDELREQLSQNAISVREKFSEDLYRKNWLKVLEE